LPASSHAMISAPSYFQNRSPRLAQVRDRCQTVFAGRILFSGR
jgi:hypothetical protein